ncbi:MAG TPA: hypothetical protein VIK99_07140 [Thermaerobacter sp.]
MTREGAGHPAPSTAAPRDPVPGRPPRAVTARVADTRYLAPGVAATVLEAPDIAATAAPLQFVQVGLPAGGSCGAAVPGRPFLRRPFSIYDADPATGRLTIVYGIVGPGTALLAGLAPGATVELLGPLGRPVPVPTSPPPRGGAPGPDAPLWLVAWSWQAVALRFLAARAVAAGVAVTALLAAEGEVARVLAGVWAPLAPPAPADRPGELAGLARAGGLHGHLAVVPPAELPALLAAALDGNGATAVAGAARPALAGPGTGPRLFAVGPRPFLRQVQRIVRDRPVDAFLVVDAYMPCGYGACLACAVPVRDGAGTRYALACTEGRWFAAGEVIL